MAQLKAIGAENAPDHWCYDLGFPAPEGLVKTVFTETTLEKFGGYEKHQFTGSNFTIIGVIDPAYTGDRPTLRFGALGEISGGKIGLEWCDPIILAIDAKSKEPPRYQLLERIRAHCKSVEYRGQRYECLPDNFGLDVTGDAGLADIAQKEWSPDIIRIMFSGSASDSPCSDVDPRLASEVYANKRVEMYFQTLNGVMSGQIKSIDKDTASELCSIRELVEKSDGSIRTRKSLMNKKEYRQMFQKSCDLADAGVMLTEVARMRGFTIAAFGLAADKSDDVDEIVAKVNAISDEADFAPANDDPYEEEYALV
jgi:hypothetical protein